ncbi:aldehyde reductase II [Aspergillus ellipticus CBS 707.79]|uniref:Aldehyde reductase II n=1 Tax=Aspergillus ellipticus CBS 707.79 TaxID=1448320 RepID=A0A319D7L3_9EURO|nr:aldehyde reductase II [Aspergillus ellipticus CBS 707.79]
MSSPIYALPRRSRILVTGANGYIASHVCDPLLKLGYRVRGTTRTPKPWLDEYFGAKYGGKLETVLVTSFEDQETLSRVLDDVQGVIHVASDVTFGPDPEAVIPWVVKAAVSILEAAAKRVSVKRVVLVSSSSAVYSLSPSPEGRTVDQGLLVSGLSRGERTDPSVLDSWNDKAVKTAWDPNTPANEKGVAVYSASKTEGERHAWKWVREHDPHYKFNTIIPCFNLGTILHPEIFRSSMGYVRNLLKGDATAVMMFEELTEHFVDVEDVARLCIVGLLDSVMTWPELVSRIRKLRPNDTLIPDALDKGIRDQKKVVSRDRAEELLQEFFGQLGWIPIHESLERGIEGWD